MSKFKYRATEFKAVNWERLVERVAGEVLVVAIDVAKTLFFLTFLRRDKVPLLTVKWTHPQESRELVEAVMSRFGPSGVEVVMEPSGTYGDALRRLWRERGASVYWMSPKRVHDAAEVYDGVPSLHDAKAAHLIGQLHLEGRSRLWEEPSEERREWQSTLKLLDYYQERRQRTLSQLEGLMARHWPEAALYLDLSSISLLKLLVSYGSPQEVAADAQAAMEQLRRDGGHWLKPEKVTGLIESARQTVGVPCVAGERRLLQRLAQELLESERECAALEKALAQTTKETPGLTPMADAVGATTAVVLCAALGSPASYPSADSFLKAAGMNLKERSSGKHKGQLKLTKRGPSVVRRYLYFAALRLIHNNADVQRWYHARVDERGPKGKVVTALMRKLLKALWHVGQGKTFEPCKMFVPLAVAA